MRSFRLWAKTLIGFDFMLTAAQFVASGVLCLLCLIVATIRGEYELVLPYLTGVLYVVVVTSCVWGGLVWITGDARKARKALRVQRPERKPRPNGDMSEVAGMPLYAPWMG